MKERIQKVLAGVGVASRRAIEEMIRAGRVSVNGKVETTLPILVDVGVDKIAVDGEAVRVKGTDISKKYYVLMYKPKGVYSTNVAQGADWAIDLLPEGFPARVYPVGRLDSESKGLLLLTNDGELTNLLTHPRYGVSKTYRAVVDGWVKDELIEQMRTGVWLSEKEGGKAYKAVAKYVQIYKRGRDKSVLDITIRESRNRQLRRMLARLGHKVRELTRVKMGPLTLEGLQAGGMRMLTGHEIRALRESVERKKGEAESKEPKAKASSLAEEKVAGAGGRRARAGGRTRGSGGK